MKALIIIFCAAMGATLISAMRAAAGGRSHLRAPRYGGQAHTRRGNWTQRTDRTDRRGRWVAVRGMVRWEKAANSR